MFLLSTGSLETKCNRQLEVEHLDWTYRRYRMGNSLFTRHCGWHNEHCRGRIGSYTRTEPIISGLLQNIIFIIIFTCLHITSQVKSRSRFTRLCYGSLRFTGLRLTRLRFFTRPCFKSPCYISPVHSSPVQLRLRHLVPSVNITSVKEGSRKFRFRFILRSVPGRAFLKLFEDIYTVQKETAFHTTKLLFFKYGRSTANLWCGTSRFLCRIGEAT